jgi:hypothetical protein
MQIGTARPPFLSGLSNAMANRSQVLTRSKSGYIDFGAIRFINTIVSAKINKSFNGIFSQRKAYFLKRIFINKIR